MTSAILICILLIIVYFLPSIIANNKRHNILIFLFNLFFGITGIGWLAALIWALCEPSQTDLAKMNAIYKYVKEQKKQQEKEQQNKNIAQKK